MMSADFLEAHLNVAWLRPESALWDAIASRVVAGHDMIRPSLDLGSGNGIFSFITAGGTFSLDYDWYRNVDTEGFWDHRDIYDTYVSSARAHWIVNKPRYRIDYAVDHKRNLLQQTKPLGLYEAACVANGNLRLPFRDHSFQTVFSNILYWLDSARASLTEIQRILLPGGRALLCLQDHKFKEYCTSYQWREHNSELLRLLNRGRSESSRWTMDYHELRSLAASLDLTIVDHSYYLSPLTLKVWDVGLRPLSPLLIKLTQKLTEDDRRAIKAEWIATVRPFLRELYELDRQSKEPGGYHFVALERR